MRKELKLGNTQKGDGLDRAVLMMNNYNILSHIRHLVDGAMLDVIDRNKAYDLIKEYAPKLQNEELE